MSELTYGGEKNWRRRERRKLKRKRNRVTKNPAKANSYLKPLVALQACVLLCMKMAKGFLA